MMSGTHISDLDVYGHGFFADILTLMGILDVDELSKQDVIRYRDQILNRAKKGKAGRRQEKPCKGCKDKKKQEDEKWLNLFMIRQKANL